MGGGSGLTDFRSALSFGVINGKRMADLIRRLRCFGLATALALALSGCASTLPEAGAGAGAQVARAATASDERPTPDHAWWPHERSDLAPDPAVRFATLDTGFRFAILRNTQPAGAVSVRLRIAAGSLLEAPDQLGLAHFLEHMAFNGSQNVPEGEMVRILERAGLAFGPDTNAYTSQSETVYQLDLPRNDEATLDTALFLLRETADKLALAPEAIERERGVVLAEERARDTPAYRALKARLRFLLPDARLTARWPGGDPAVLQGTPREAFTRYYDTYYRPERAMLSVAGDIDPALVEAKVRARFADWTRGAPDPQDPAAGPLTPRALAGDVFIEPTLPETVTVTWLAGPEARLQTRATLERDLRRSLAIATLNRRLQDAARGEGAPFLSASFSVSDVEGAARAATLTVSARRGTHLPALAAAQVTLRQVLAGGFDPGEIARVKADFRAAYETAAEGAATRPTARLADALIADFAQRAVTTAPAQDLALYSEIEPRMTPEAALAALRELIGAGPPLLFLTAPQASADAATALMAAWRAGESAPLPSFAPQRAIPFPYESFGPQGALLSRAEIADLGVTQVRFTNGVALNVKRTDFAKDRIEVFVRIAGGRLDLPPEPALSAFASALVVEGGLGRLTAAEIDRAFAGRVAGVRFGVGEDHYALTGATTPADFPAQLRLMAAYLSDPGFRGEPLERLRGLAETQLRQFEATPGGVFGRDAAAILHSGDRRWAYPTIEEISALSLERVREVLGRALLNHPLEVTVVGDVDVERVLAEVSVTLGALPPRPTNWQARRGAEAVRFPGAGAQSLRTHAGPRDQSLTFAGWPAPDFSDPRAARTAELLGELLQLRLTEEVRERLGAAYSPFAQSFASKAFLGYGYVAAGAQTRPETVEAFEAALLAITAELREDRYSEDALARARAPLIDRAEVQRRTNAYWTGALSAAQSDPVTLDAVRTRIADLRGVTRAEVTAMARRVFASAPVQIRVEPLQAGAQR